MIGNTLPQVLNVVAVIGAEVQASISYWACVCFAWPCAGVSKACAFRFAHEKRTVRDTTGFLARPTPSVSFGGHPRVDGHTFLHDRHASLMDTIDMLNDHADGMYDHGQQAVDQWHACASQAGHAVLIERMAIERL